MSAFFTDLLHILQNPYIALIFFTALVFDFINGFHDAANSIATVPHATIFTCRNSRNSAGVMSISSRKM